MGRSSEGQVDAFFVARSALVLHKWVRQTTRQTLRRVHAQRAVSMSQAVRPRTEPAATDLGLQVPRRFAPSLASRVSDPDSHIVGRAFASCQQPALSYKAK